MADWRAVSDWLREWQSALVADFERADGVGRFVADDWTRPGGGGGRTMCLKDGEVWERIGVNFSHVFGDALPEAASAERPHLVGAKFNAVGVSVIAHPCNPHVPASHANLRFFVAEPVDAETLWWFGGGCDLTPCYGYDEDCRDWHRRLREACAPFGDDVYARLKRQCDEYFYLPHRDEARGIGGLFFDDWNHDDFERDFEFMRAVAQAYPEAYLPLAARRRHQDFSPRQRQFQLWRRGRYVEFNLLWDRGTRFGIESGGRADSILISLPPLASWEYGFEAEPGSPEAEFAERYLKPGDW